MNAVATLRSAEADFVTALSSAADALDAVGTSALDAALAKLEAAAESARARLAGAMYRMNAIISGVTAAIEGQAAALRDDLGPAEATPAFETPANLSSTDGGTDPVAIAEPAASHSDDTTHDEPEAPTPTLTPADPGVIELAGYEDEPAFVAACAAVNDEPPATPPLFPLADPAGPYGREMSANGRRGGKRRKPR